MALRSARRRATPLVLGLLLAGCAGTGDDPAVSPSPSASEGATPTPSVSSPSPTASATGPADGTTDDVAVPFPATVQQASQDPSADAFGTVTDVRTGHHEGYDRIVLTYEGTGTPGWSVAPVDVPLQDGSGAPVDVAGTTFLDVYVLGTGYPMDTGVAEYAGPDPLVPDPASGGARNVSAVAYEGVFEGATQVVVGLDGQARPFRVFTLSDPTRVVIDVQSP